MIVFQVQIKTHSRESLNHLYEGKLNPCVVHGRLPEIQKIIAGRRKDVHFVALCEHEDCNKITDTADKVVEHWNKWNPKNQNP